MNINCYKCNYDRDCTSIYVYVYILYARTHTCTCRLAMVLKTRTSSMIPRESQAELTKFGVVSANSLLKFGVLDCTLSGFALLTLKSLL